MQISNNYCNTSFGSVYKMNLFFNGVPLEYGRNGYQESIYFAYDTLSKALVQQNTCKRRFTQFMRVFGAHDKEYPLTKVGGKYTMNIKENPDNIDSNAYKYFKLGKTRLGNFSIFLTGKDAELIDKLSNKINIFNSIRQSETALAHVKMRSAAINRFMSDCEKGVKRGEVGHQLNIYMIGDEMQFANPNASKRIAKIEIK